MIESGEECWTANVSSVGTFMMMPKNTAYLLTRHAFQSFSECLYLEMQLKDASIHVLSALPVMVKTGIVDASAGKGEPEDAAAFRAAMCNFIGLYGMDVDEACKIMIEQIAERKFWVSSQLEMPAGYTESRADILQKMKDPTISEEGKPLVGAK